MTLNGVRWWAVSELDTANLPHDLPHDALGVLEVRVLGIDLELQLCLGPSGRTVGLWRNEHADLLAVVLAGDA
ncbi:MAG: hypothetical protein IT379_04185 [Deltaproteobacteria bacterium]|nr:hypothetical protein [Deltaproteobacteria bacterium]